MGQKNNEFNKTVSVYVGDDKYVGFSYESYKKFQSAYKKAIEDITINHLNINDYAITSEYGDVILLSYSKFVVKYLEDSFEASVA